MLRRDGLIFVSIDDNEFHNLRHLMDEVFGEQNFISTIVWQRKRGRDNSAKFFSKSHEYILGYARDIACAEVKKLEIGEGTKEAYKNPDNDPRGPYRLMGAWARGIQGGSEYVFTSKTGKRFSKRLWLASEETLASWDVDDRLVFVGDKVYRKLFLKEHSGAVPETIWDDASNAANAADEMKLIFGRQEFETPKPVPLVKRLIDISTEKDDIVLDSFAGSGTTAHATLAANAEDGGSRRFILIEGEEYADRITAERVRRVIKGVAGAADPLLKKGLGGAFSYFELGKPVEVASLLSGADLPSYKDMARYVFFTATGLHLDEGKLDARKFFVGSSPQFDVFLLYKPSLDFLKATALTLERAEALGKPNGKRRLVFAPAKYLDQEQLEEHKIDFAQLPFEIYRRAQ